MHTLCLRLLLLLLLSLFLVLLFISRCETKSFQKIYTQLSDEKYLLKIVNGTPAEENEFPYMAMLTRSNGYLFCAGALIGDYYVLTAAHCLINKISSSLIVRLGDYDRTSEKEAKHVNIAIHSVTIHPKFKYATTFHDLAIIRLASAAPRTSNIDPICLPPATKNFIGQTAIISGWGSQAVDGFSVKFLHKLEMKILSENECKNLLGGYSIFIRPEKICAWERNKDSCKGDSGGPLMWEDSNKSMKRHLIGIISMGFCGQENRPGLFTRISAYLDWIKNNTRDDHTICWM